MGLPAVCPRSGPTPKNRFALKTRDLRLVLLRQDSGKSSERLPREFRHDSTVVARLDGAVASPALRSLATNAVSPSVVDFNGTVVTAYLPDYRIHSRGRKAEYQAFVSPHAFRRERISLTRAIGTQLESGPDNAPEFATFGTAGGRF